jgi:uncharacterized membrane protein
VSDTAPEPEPTREPVGPIDDSWSSQHPMAAYSLGRLVLFAVPFAVLYFVADFFTALLIAFLVSAAASIFLLRKQREAMSVSIATRAARANEKMAERSAVEDALDDAERQGDASDGRAG